jgi:hypothetical protein
MIHGRMLQELWYPQPALLPLILHCSLPPPRLLNIRGYGQPPTYAFNWQELSLSTRKSTHFWMAILPIQTSTTTMTNPCCFVRVFPQILTNKSGLIEYRAHRLKDRTTALHMRKKMKVHVFGKLWRNNWPCGYSLNWASQFLVHSPPDVLWKVGYQ